MRVAVLGAGVVGVTAAWYLAGAGHDVIVIDRQPAPAQETSFANGGQISASHAEPWANPAAPLKILHWLGREDAPCFGACAPIFVNGCGGCAFCANVRQAGLAPISRPSCASPLQPRRPVEFARGDRIEYDHLERGILHFYSDQREFEHAIVQAALMREHGCERVVKNAAECLAIEPTLAAGKVGIIGGTFTASDESGDACKFTGELAKRCQQLGVTFRYGVPIECLLPEAGHIAGVCLPDGEVLVADTYVAALGSYTPLLLRSLGMMLSLIPAKGYSATIPLHSESIAPTVSLIDDQCKLVFSRLGNRLRVAGTAEFGGYDTSLNAVRCAALLERTLALFPRAGRRDEVEFWAGLRPATPGNVPLIGATRYSNLFLNTGHGTLGWTMACGSGRLLADLVSGRTPEIDAADYAPD